MLRTVDNPKPVPLPCSFVVKKRAENLVDDVRGNAASCVNDIDEDMRPGFKAGRHDRILLVNVEILRS